MRDQIIRSLELAMEYLQAAILCRQAGTLDSHNTNVVRAQIELDRVEAELANERDGTEGISD